MFHLAITNPFKLTAVRLCSAVNNVDKLPPNENCFVAVKTSHVQPYSTHIHYNSCGVLHRAVFGVQFKRKTGEASLAFQRFHAMIVKHAIHSWRNRKVTLVQLLVPVVFTILGCVTVLTLPRLNEADSPALELKLSHFNKPTVPYISFGPWPLSATLASSYSEVASEYGQPVDAETSNMTNYLLEVADRSMDDYNRLHIVAATADGSGSGSIVGHFNNFALHAIAISLSLVDNAVLHYAVPGSPRIVTVNHPLPWSVNTRTNEEADNAAATAYIFTYNVAFGLAFLVGSFVVFIVNQRANKSKHSQFVSGVDAVAFWLAAFFWDLLSFAVPSVLIIVVILAFQMDGYSEWPVIG